MPPLQKMSTAASKNGTKRTHLRLKYPLGEKFRIDVIEICFFLKEDTLVIFPTTFSIPSVIWFVSICIGSEWLYPALSCKAYKADERIQFQGFQKQQLRKRFCVSTDIVIARFSSSQKKTNPL